MTSNSLKSEATYIEKKLHDKGFTHLYSLTRGYHIAIYSKDDEDKVNRARLTNIKEKQYQLSMADHRGKWEVTPFTGSIDELIEMLITNFSFALIDY